MADLLTHRRDTVGGFFTHLLKLAFDFAADASLKGFNGGKKVYKILQERLKDQPAPILLNTRRKLEDVKPLEEMKLAKMEDMESEVKQQRLTAGKAVGEQELLNNKKIPPEGIKELELQNPNKKRIFILSRL